MAPVSVIFPIQDEGATGPSLLGTGDQINGGPMSPSFRVQSLFVFIRLADGQITVWQLIAGIGCILSGLVQDRKCS